MKFGMRWIVAAALLAAGGASQAQFSDSYNFLKAVRDADGQKVTDALSKAGGSSLINTRDFQNNETGLHIVTKRRDATWLNFLIGKGANPVARDSQGMTPLMLAAQLGWVEGAELLVRRQGGINLSNNAGETPLIMAVQKRDLPMVRMLLSSGADPTISDRVAGKSAKDYAAEDRRAGPILKLIEEAKAPKKGMGPSL